MIVSIEHNVTHEAHLYGMWVGLFSKVFIIILHRVLCTYASSWSLRDIGWKRWVVIFYVHYLKSSSQQYDGTI